MGRHQAALSLFQGRRHRRSDRRQRPPLGAGRCALKGRTLPGMIRPRQTVQPASRGPSPKTYRPRPPGFCGGDLASQIWPSLTLPVRPVGGVCACPRFRPNTCVFGQTLGRGWRRGPIGQVGFLMVREAGPRTFGARREAEYKAAETRSNISILLTDWYSIVWWGSLV